MQLGSVLDAQGATAVKLSSLALTHLITVSLPIDDNLESLPQGSMAHLVTLRWVERSRILGAQQDPEHYSPDPAMLFSGITATASDISQSDTDIMSATIAALGGQWRTALTRDVTHLFALAPGSVKTAMHFRDTTGMCILAPHWFDDSVRLGIKGLPTKSYEWHEPRVFHARSESRTPEEELEFKIPAKRRLLYDTALMDDGDMPPTKAPSGNVWNGLRILLSTTLELSDSQRAAREADIIRQGGVVIGFDSPQSADTQTIRDEELKKIDEADVFVTRYRTGAAYVKVSGQPVSR
ncbi:hypothetical protein A0H81_01582 [Grifola frondosa]|uniref:BRCT domain-containing protein n=1 Tax=Grifola frondosa TaxID=5627 RepID=A0A1C7MLY6_GRIFR|nr:hypothetical protein A0H81_01582 [Grifola frondosa]